MATEGFNTEPQERPTHLFHLHLPRSRNPELVAWMNEPRRLGERERDCVDCGQTFTFKSALAVRCPSCRVSARASSAKH
jgi:hypothetical protein